MPGAGPPDPPLPPPGGHPGPPPVAMTIAGSDSGGGAGLQADLRVFAAHRVHGTAVVTAVTAQSTVGVRGVATMEPEFVALQVVTVTDDMAVAAVKTGMLATGDIVRAVAALAVDGRLPHLVVDPVLVSSTGHPLMDDDGVAAYRAGLLPGAEVATPNLREAAALTGRSLTDLGSTGAMAEVAEELRSWGPTWVVVKGGHFDLATGDAGAGAPDVVAGPGGTFVLEAPRVVTPNDHGTGCSLSASIAARLARGDEPADAVRGAKAFVHDALRRAAAWRLGGGHGPIDHLEWGVEPGG